MQRFWRDRFDRRGFLHRSAASAAGLVVASELAEAPPADAATGTRTWLGPTLWANRLEDWQLSNGRIECLEGTERGRTVSLLTQALAAGNTSATITMRTGTLASGSGFSGFIVGCGAGALDYRAAALVMCAGGTGGGLLCTYESDGHVRFRDHSSESQQLSWPVLTPTSTSGPAPARTLGEDVLLTLAITSLGSGRFSLKLTAADAATGTVRSTATLSGVADARLRGGISLVSSPSPTATGARYWFRSPAASGAKVQTAPARALGPIIGTLYSLNQGVLKLTAQLMPIGTADPQTAQLQYRRHGTAAWTAGPTATLGAGFSLLFRISGWDAAHDYDYQVVYGAGTSQQATYGGLIRHDPVSKNPLVIGLVDCTIHSFRPLDRASSGAAKIPGSRTLGLYTPNSLYFPYTRLVGNLTKQNPDLLVALGDQLYEYRPTVADRSPAPTLDYLYRYYLWLWTFGGLTRNVPTIVLVDDHDVDQGNLWGHGGAPAPNGDQNQGGYVKAASFINMLQQVQCGHNPDAFNATPVQQSITVYYSSFRYGGVSFAVIEDRKFKGGDADGLQANGTPYPPTTTPLLGSRQEQFLQSWASMDAGLPKVCLSQTTWACMQTDESGAAVVDYDSDGYPSVARKRAVQLVKAAKALLVAGDQHLATLVRHGISTHTDGPMQFTIPAAGSAFQRWFEPAGTLPNAGPTPHTGDWTDGFGNDVRVLAVANPSVTYATYRQHYPGKGQNLGDQNLKPDGYGIVRVDKTNQRFVIECWPWQVDPTAAGAAQYPGWPYTLPFSSV